VDVKSYALYSRKDLEPCVSLDVQLKELTKKPDPVLLPAPTDGELAAAFKRLCAAPASLKVLNDWELDFVADMPLWFAQRKKFTEKQRQKMLQIAEKLGAKI